VEHKIKQSNCWNFDETGFRIGCLGSRIVFTFEYIKAVYLSDPDLRETITFVESVNGDGTAAMPMLILPGNCLLEKHFNNSIADDILWATNETGSGYISDMLAIDWLEFWEKQTRPEGYRGTRQGEIQSEGVEDAHNG
jgi:hypothetical protein